MKRNGIVDFASWRDWEMVKERERIGCKLGME